MSHLSKVWALLICISSCVTLAYGDEVKSLEGFHNDSEAGVVVTTGNSVSQSFNLKQTNTYSWIRNLFRFNAAYLKTSANGTDTSRYYLLGLRYERELIERLSVFLGQNLESDPFAGYLQRYNSDVGGKYFIVKEETFYWDTELGYRYTIENRRSGQLTQHYLRLYTEANRQWNKAVSTKLWAEYLPNLTISGDYQLNTEASVSAALNEIFAIKVGYLVKYRNVPVAPALHKTDTQFTTALVAKF